MFFPGKVVREDRAGEETFRRSGKNIPEKEECIFPMLRVYMIYYSSAVKMFLSKGHTILYLVRIVWYLVMIFGTKALALACRQRPWQRSLSPGQDSTVQCREVLVMFTREIRLFY